MKNFIIKFKRIQVINLYKRVVKLYNKKENLFYKLAMAHKQNTEQYYTDITPIKIKKMGIKELNDLINSLKNDYHYHTFI